VSQAQPAPAPAPSAQPATVATVGKPAPAVAPEGFEDVPQLLNRLQVAAVAVCLIFGVLSALLQFLGWQANGKAADNTEQLVRVQAIQSSLLRADALATNAFLVGGLEAPEQRAEYDEALDDALRRIADAAEAQPADREALAALNTEVAGYASAIAQARDNNRQGFPIGAEYLLQAGDTLRPEIVTSADQTIPAGQARQLLDSLVAANSERAEDEMSGQQSLWIFLIGMVALVALWWLNRQLARRFHRRINIGLAAAAVAIAVLTLLATFLGEDQAGDNDALREGSYQDAVDGASVRSLANDAKANESLRLIKRGSGATYEDFWNQADAGIRETASTETLSEWKTYAALHDQIVTEDTEGDWDKAVGLATSTESGASSAALAAVDRSAQADADEAAQQTTDTLRSGRGFALALAAATLLLGLVAATLCAWGVNQRRREYA
jgi:hypothetical protein